MHPYTKRQEAKQPKKRSQCAAPPPRGRNGRYADTRQEASRQQSVVVLSVCLFQPGDNDFGLLALHP